MANIGDTSKYVLGLIKEKRKPTSVYPFELQKGISSEINEARFPGGYVLT